MRFKLLISPGLPLWSWSRPGQTWRESSVWTKSWRGEKWHLSKSIDKKETYFLEVGLIFAIFLSTSGFAGLKHSHSGLALRPGGLRSRVLFHTRGHRQCGPGEIPNLPHNYLYYTDKLQWSYHDPSIPSPSVESTLVSWVPFAVSCSSLAHHCPTRFLG